MRIHHARFTILLLCLLAAAACSPSGGSNGGDQDPEPTDPCLPDPCTARHMTGCGPDGPGGYWCLCA